jgi:hypothetical protein
MPVWPNVLSRSSTRAPEFFGANATGVQDEKEEEEEEQQQQQQQQQQQEPEEDGGAVVQQHFLSNPIAVPYMVINNKSLRPLT